MEVVGQYYTKMKIRTISTLLASVILLTSLVAAFGVSTSYWEGNPLKMFPGQEKTVSMNLQNKAGATEDVTVEITLLGGSEIVSLSKTRYTVDAGGDIDVPLSVTIPEKDALGTEYTISLEVKTVTEGGGGVNLGIGVTSEFDVLVVDRSEADVDEAPEKKGIPIIVYLLLAIVVLVILFLIKKSKE